MKLLIVESPGKILKLKSILGPEWSVKASVGHIRHLANDGEGKLGFDFVQNGIDCRYVPRSSKAKEVIAGLRAAAKAADEVFIATDADREGETIGWHVAQVLGIKTPQRAVFTEITPKAVLHAVKNPRALKHDLVAAGKCRDCLDKLVGYKGSPLVWRLNNGATSMGRVQSAVLHLISAREQEIQKFKPKDYWNVFVDYTDGFRAFYHSGNASVDSSVDGVDDSGEGPKGSQLSKVLSQEQADNLVRQAKMNTHIIKTIQGKEATKKPPVPFITSALQQVAGSKLGLDPEATMKAAQALYERGLITYMRTDSTELSDDFRSAAKSWLQANDPDNVPSKSAKAKKSNAKNAQEAHEAIRPTNLAKASAELRQELSKEQFDLYVLIWKRAIASQCKPAKLQKSQVIVTAGPTEWIAKGQMVSFKGYSKWWNDISGDKLLPELADEQALSVQAADSEQKQTQPPSRYSEPKLVQVMEKKGIGRPSTYAPTVKTLKDRDYIHVDGKKIKPTAIGLEVDQLLQKVLPDLIKSDFTAAMEEQLDEIARGNLDWEDYLTDWNAEYFAPAIQSALADLPPNEYTGGGDFDKSRTKCPKCSNAMSKIPTKSKKVKKGHFLACKNGCKGADGEADLVMFWNDNASEWRLPGVCEHSGHDCPVCSKPLEIYHYKKDGQKKKLLRCSDPASAKKKDHEKVVYFFIAKDNKWWSPEFGELEAKETAAV